MVQAVSTDGRNDADAYSSIELALTAAGMMLEGGASAASVAGAMHDIAIAAGLGDVTADVNDSVLAISEHGTAHVGAVAISSRSYDFATPPASPTTCAPTESTPPPHATGWTPSPRLPTTPAMLPLLAGITLYRGMFYGGSHIQSAVLLVLALAGGLTAGEYVTTTLLSMRLDRLRAPIR